MMSARPALAAALLVALAATDARAAPPSLRLSYSRGRGAGGCPDERALRAAIATQLGRDAFVIDTQDHADANARDANAGDGASDRDANDRDAANANAGDDGDGDDGAVDDGRDDGGVMGSIVADVREVRSHLRARIELHGADGALLGARELRGSDCRELAPAMTLAIAMAIDTLTTVRPAPPRPLVARAADGPVIQDLDEGDKPLLAPETLPEEGIVTGLRAPPAVPRWRVSVGLLGAINATAVAAFGLTVQSDLVRRHYSVGVELRGVLPTTTQAGPATLVTSLWSAALVPCARHKWASACALAALGDEQAQINGLAITWRLSRFWAALGGRIAVDVPIINYVALRLHVDVLAPLVRNQVSAAQLFGTVVTYRTQPVQSSFGFAAVARIP